MRKFLIAGVIGAMLAAVPAGAWAHECFNASRSAQGNEGASHSSQWLTVTPEEFVQDPELGLTPAQVTQALAMIDAMQAAGDLPESWTIFIGKRTIGENGRAFVELGKASDGKGIDWIFSAQGEQLFTVLCTVVPDHPFCAEPGA